ncbi:L-aspartate oxidase [Acinetobacter nectaris]|uniref:L-aspartate oxidase n=1 Tax=Acinetobacter nectaris TaxID=1219382 RepID=UPI001F025929|nr:L-aspartate oxidase [Acinetobacter nectaris]MCF8998862.1 L-aspartate oxidase [Acinetobacter nectaris]MCF9027897.1 L-aspartate oxidase [Acinetobacter nectaris]
MVQSFEYDVVIVGAGLAGLTVALSLPKNMRVGLFLKDDIHICSSYMAQGGIAAVLAETDTIENHVENTCIAGAGLCHVENTRKILEQAPEAIAWLQQKGVVFDVDPSLETDVLHLTKEGGHDHRRIVHVADHTGKSVIQALVKQLENATHIDCLIGYDVESLITREKNCQGVVCRKDDEQRAFIAKHTVLATGGVGQLFERTTNPITSKGEGVALAWEAGCRIANLEFIQFHPTGLAIPNADGFLISEALRGEGGILRNVAGHRFMPDYDERAELAPRDIVARAISKEILKQNQQPVFLDMTHLDAEFIQNHFPAIYAKCHSLGLDICHEMIPVAPTVHYSCGGVLTDALGHTDIEHLYAVGEVACTGLHGANRLASNSLLECIVVGRSAAQYMVEQAVWNIPHLNEIQVLAQKPLNAATTSEVDFSHEILQQWMSRYFGIVRTEEGLMRLYAQLVTWKKAFPANKMITTALLMVKGALNRRESRGAHFNQEYPSVMHDVFYSIHEDV